MSKPQLKIICLLFTIFIFTGCDWIVHPGNHINLWTWISGNYNQGQAGKYGSKGTAASAHIPGARSESINWTDSSSNFWIFGGNGYDSSGIQGYLNDLWEYQL